MHPKGFITLITVLIVLAIVLVIGPNINLLSVSEAKMALQKKQSSQAFYLANFCAEEALMKLKENSEYSGNETLYLENGSCEILPIEGNWTVKVSGSFSDQIKKIKIIISQIAPEMIIDSWGEVANF